MDDEDLPLLERAPIMSNEAFRSIFRVSRESFSAILTALRSSRGIPEKGPDLEDKTSLLITLYRLSTHQSSKSISEIFGMPDTAIRSTYLNTVARLCRLTEEYVRFPEIQHRTTLSAEFPGVVCALSYDFIQLNALAQPTLEQTFRQCEEMMETGVYIQATTTREGSICQFSCYPAGTRPLNKLSENRTWTHGEENPLLLSGQCALTDMNGRCTPWLICPYPAPSGTHSCMEQFNDRLISVVNRTVRRDLRRLKQRFRSLMDRSPFTEVSIFNVVNACVVMHNICVEHGDTTLFEEFEDDEPEEPEYEDTDELFVYSEYERHECPRAVAGPAICARALKKRAQYEEANIVSEQFPVPRQHQGAVEDPGLPIDKRQRLNPAEDGEDEDEYDDDQDEDDWGEMQDTAAWNPPPTPRPASTRPEAPVQPPPHVCADMQCACRLDSHVHTIVTEPPTSISLYEVAKLIELGPNTRAFGDRAHQQAVGEFRRDTMLDLLMATSGAGACMVPRRSRPQRFG